MTLHDRDSRALIAELKSRGLTAQEILEIYQNTPCIPASAFATDLTPFETAVVYLHQKSHPQKDIARMLKRSTSSVNNALANATKKKTTIGSLESKELIPTAAFHDTRITPAEALVAYLIETYGMRNIDVAGLIGRDPRNTHHLYRESQRKRGGRT